jgi:hypothetical protein
MIILIPFIIFFALTYGALGGAMAWLLFHVLYVLLGTWLTHRHLLKGVGSIWLIHDVGIPLILSFVAGLTEYYLIQSAEYSSYMKLILASGLALTTILFSVALLPTHMRTVLLQNIRRGKYHDVELKSSI